MINFLSGNVDMHAWKLYDMPGIDTEVMCHRLHNDKNYKPINVKPMREAPNNAKACDVPNPVKRFSPQGLG